MDSHSPPGVGMQGLCSGVDCRCGELDVAPPPICPVTAPALLHPRKDELGLVQLCEGEMARRRVGQQDKQGTIGSPQNWAESWAVTSCLVSRENLCYGTAALAVSCTLTCLLSLAGSTTCIEALFQKLSFPGLMLIALDESQRRAELRDAKLRKIGSCLSLDH